MIMVVWSVAITVVLVVMVSNATQAVATIKAQAVLLSFNHETVNLKDVYCS